MKRLRKWYNNLNLQNRLFFSYICLILGQLFLFSTVYYKIASDGIIDTVKENVLDTTVKNLELAEEQLERIEERAEWASEEPGIKEALKKTGSAGGLEIIGIDSQVSRVLDKYFYEEDIASACLLTPGYVLGNNSQVRVPVKQFYKSKIYHKISEQKEKSLWLPTYFAKEEYKLEWAVEQAAVFTYLYRLEDTVKASGELQEEKKTILMVSLKTDLLRKIFEENNSNGRFAYCVSSSDGRIIVHTDREKEGTMEELPWKNLPDGDVKGTMPVYYQGQEMVACYAVSESLDWTAVSMCPVPELLADVKRIQYLTYGITGLSFALALLLAMSFARRITKPVESLAAAMKKAEEGDFSEKIPVNGNDEIQYLVRRYNEMGLKIEKLIEENYKGELRNKESEIMALNLQLNPHFLYNTLNVINLMALEEGEIDISRMIISVSDMMQYTFRNKQEMAKLADEMEWLKNYTYIMEHRFEGKFQVIYHIDINISEYKVPKLLFQPVVENAIIHGFEKIDSGGVLEISCEQKNDMLYINVADNGQGMTEERLKAVMDGSTGRTGIMNMKKRLALVYGENTKVYINTSKGNGCIVCIILPCNQPYKEGE